MIKANHPERGQTEFTQKMWDALGSNKQGWVQGVEKPAEIVAFEANLRALAHVPAPPLALYGAIETQKLPILDSPLAILLLAKEDLPAAPVQPPTANSTPKAKRKRKTK